MKREWTYLAALLPYTTAISSSMAFGATSDEWDGDAFRHKSKASQEQDGESDGQGGKDGRDSSSKSDAKTPGDAASGFDGLDGPGGGGGLGESGAQSSIASVPHVADGMFAPLDGPAGGAAMPIMLGGGGGGGGGIAVTSTTKVIYTGSEGAGSEGGEPLPDNGGYVDPDPEDADAMLILVGGYAEGAGEGATSSGDVVFDIVDYGEITFGYGYATFMASGASGAAADTFFSVTGADLVFSYSTGPSSGDSAYSTTHVLAIDFEDESMFGEQHLTGFDWMQLLAEGPFEQNILGEEEHVSVNGNASYTTFEGSIQDGASPSQIDFANLVYDNLGSVVTAQFGGENVSFSMQGEAEGVETLILAGGNLLEIEDQYSSVGGSAIGIA